MYSFRPSSAMNSLILAPSHFSLTFWPFFVS